MFILKILTHKLRHGDKRDLDIQGRLRLQTQYLINFFRVLTNAMEIDASVSYETSLSFFYKIKFAQRNLLLSVQDKPVQIEKL